ncbi:TRAP transporter fused permease subunit [Pararhodobacter sp. CCB-MM2]|uniref:TRAP transporter permease n=1 Tax=Pararhodobacter sp. CCB-MM2 TaxID=1786003 RepID=UPI0009F1E7B3|nr:TRAP transporter fused permease subunit [Pararhodobacter sp. CCB-MM2]
MRALVNTTLAALLVAVPLLGILWALNVPQMLGVRLVTQQIVAVVLGLSTAAALLGYPYGKRAGALDYALALIAAGSWLWYAWNFETWMVSMAFRTPDMWIPGIFALVLLVEALRKTMGLVIAGLVWLVALYGFVGDWIPGILQAAVFAPTRTVLYLYADSNGVPGMVITVIVTLVLPFMVFGKVMEIVGGMAFFNNLALAMVGHRRGGPAKVSIVASGFFGMLSGSTVANIMSTGVFTIPLMVKSGMKRVQAAAIEAVASNGGQIAPPIMGTTAFIMAEFLQVPYTEIMVAASIPALFYFLILFLKVDAMAQRNKVRGLDRSEMPNLLDTLKGGWEMLISIGLLLYLLFSSGLQPGMCALIASALMLVIWVVKSRFRIDLAEFGRALLSLGREFVPLALIGGAAGVIIGLMNSTGFAFQLSLALTHLASAYGLFALLLLAALVAIVLGMGMPTAAVYIVLVTVVAPTVIDFGVTPISAHMFLLYFGLMSMVTPPIAIGSIVAARVAGANMWQTGFLSMRIGIAAYCLPFLWVYNPALLLKGTPLQIAIVVATVLSASFLLKQSMLESPLAGLPNRAFAVLMTAAAFLALASTALFGPEAPLAVLIAIAGFALAGLCGWMRGKSLEILAENHS